MEEAKRIRERCPDSDSLDVKLDILITSKKENLSARPRAGPVDIDSNGSWGNVVRALEDG